MAHEIERQMAAEDERLRTENDELKALFELQQTRMGEATAAWVAEDPEGRALMMPDLGQLLTWLLYRGGLTTFGAHQITAERRRQIEVEGYTSEHDAEHDDRELLAAASCYLDVVLKGPRRGVPDGWPWAHEDWKPSMRDVRNLAKAGALIAAEIDRLRAQ